MKQQHNFTLIFTTVLPIEIHYYFFTSKHAIMPIQKAVKTIGFLSSLICTIGFASIATNLAQWTIVVMCAIACLIYSLTK